MTDPLNHSYYAATAHKRQPQRDIEGDLECDVAVIGGGFTGLSAALACAERGFSVILIEAEHVGFGASGRMRRKLFTFGAHIGEICGMKRMRPAI